MNYGAPERAGNATLCLPHERVRDRRATVAADRKTELMRG
jgi:hypothetical protein